MLNLKAKGVISGLGFSFIQLLLLATLPLPSVEAQTPCSPERVSTLAQRLRNESPPSPESREIRSERHRFKFQVPANYRAVTSIGGNILILSPEAYEFHQCRPRTTFWYAAARIQVMDSDLHPSASLEQVFERRPGYRPEGRVQRVSLAGIPALRYHDHEGGDGLTRRYFLRSPQGTKDITIFSWVNSVNDREPEVLSRITNNFELLFSVTEDPPRVGIVPTLEFCGLAVWNDPDDKLTHILTAVGGSSSANFRLDNQLLQLRSTGPEINPGRTGTPSSFTFQNSDRSIRVRLQGDWRIGATGGWVTDNATLEVIQGNQSRELSVFASLGCQFLFY
ncbi:hypothetical protein [Limnospira fusiformis]|uniref:hypothetical protein n=1 Tax=Limnospira fusiformis TaxID=54297 RepID=UPI002AA1EFCF|nr:hypothetical protein [Limnospira fusiformis LS22]